MARKVVCALLGKEGDGMDYAPYPGPLGQRIYDSISKQAWQRWLAHQADVKGSERRKTILLGENAHARAHAEFRHGTNRETLHDGRIHRV